MTETHTLNLPDLKVTVEVEEKPDRFCVRIRTFGDGWSKNRQRVEKWYLEFAGKWDADPRPIEMDFPQTGHSSLVVGDATNSVGVLNFPSQKP